MVKLLVSSLLTVALLLSVVAYSFAHMAAEPPIGSTDQSTPTYDETRETQPSSTPESEPETVSATGPEPGETTAKPDENLPPEPPETDDLQEETTSKPSKPVDPTEETTRKPSTEKPTKPVETEPPVTEPEEPVDPDAPVAMYGADALNNLTGAAQIDFIVLSEDGKYVTITPSASDPYYYPMGAPANITGARYVAIKYRSPNAEGTAVQLYIGSTGTGPADDTSMLRKSINADGKWHLAIFDTQSLIDAGIYDGSTVSYFRFDPLECDYILDENGMAQKDDTGNWLRYPMPEDAYIDVQYIAFFNSAEAAKAYNAQPKFIAGPSDMASSETNMAIVTDNGKYATADGNVEGSIGDGWFVPMDGASVPGSVISVVYRSSSETLSSRSGEIFAGSGVSPVAGSSTTFTYINDGKWHMAVIDVSGHPDLTGNMAYLRYDFCTDTRDIIIDIAYIAVFETAEQAEAYYALTTLASAVDPITAGANNGTVCKDSQGADNNSAYVVGWVGFAQNMVAAGYSIDNAAIEWNGVLNDVPADDPVRAPVNGGDLAKRYNISAPLTNLAFGAHNIKFYIELEDGTIVLIHEIDCETKDPSAVEDSTIVFDSAKNADLQGAFTFGPGAAADQCNYTSAPYKMSGINQLTTKMEGTYVWTVSNYASTARAWGTLFVRGLPTPNFGDGNYYGHDSKGEESVGCAGIYINLFEGKLRINVKGMGDGNVSAPNWVEVPYSGKDLTIADDGHNVTIYNGNTLLAGIMLEGNKAGMAERATVVLADGTYYIFTDLAVAASVMSADIGFIARHADVTFSATAVRPLAGVNVPAIPELGEMPEDPEAPENNSLHLGANALVVTDGYYGTEFAFTAPYTGTYVFSYAEGETNAYSVITDTQHTTYTAAPFPHEHTLNAGETLILVIGTYDSNPDTIDIIISEKSSDTNPSLAPMWDVSKSIVTHQSFDELRLNGSGGSGVFTPGQADRWGRVANLDADDTSLYYWGWIGAKGELGQFGYQIDDNEPIFDDGFTYMTEDSVIAAAASTGADSASRMAILIDVSGLSGQHTVYVYYKDDQGRIVKLNEFIVNRN